MKPQEIKGLLKDQVCFCIGGGPSALHVPHDHVIVSNLSIRLNPNALAMYFADCKFYTNFNKEIDNSQVTYKMTSCQYFMNHKEYVFFKKGGKSVGELNSLVGTNSGLHAAHIAVKMEAYPIVLVGYDLNDRTHFHNEYLTGVNAPTKFVREFEYLRGQEIYVTNEKSALRHIFPYKPLKHFGV